MEWLLLDRITMCMTFSFWIQLENVITDKLCRAFAIVALPVSELLWLVFCHCCPALPGQVGAELGTAWEWPRRDKAGLSWSKVTWAVTRGGEAGSISDHAGWGDPSRSLSWQSKLPSSRASWWWTCASGALTVKTKAANPYQLRGLCFSRAGPGGQLGYFQPSQRAAGISSRRGPWGSCSSMSKAACQAGMPREKGTAPFYLFKVCSRVRPCRGSDSWRGQTLLFNLRGFASFLVWGRSVLPWEPHSWSPPAL